METIDEIIKHWYSYGDDIEKKRVYFANERKKYEDIIAKFKLEYEKRAAVQKDVPGAIRDITEFADMLHVSHSDIPFSADNYETKSISKEISFYEERRKTAFDLEGAYKRYTSIYHRSIKGALYTDYESAETTYEKSREILELRKGDYKYIQEYEWWIDMCLLRNKANIKYEEALNNKYKFSYLNDSDFGDWYRVYGDIYYLILKEDFYDFRHPINDAGWKDGTSDLILAIVGVSYLHKYLCMLKDRIDHYERIGDKKSLREIKKYEKENSIISYWKKDTSLIENSPQKDSVFYKTYKSVITDGVKKKVDEFIATI